MADIIAANQMYIPKGKALEDSFEQKKKLCRFSAEFFEKVILYFEETHRENRNTAAKYKYSGAEIEYGERAAFVPIAYRLQNKLCSHERYTDINGVFPDTTKLDDAQYYH